MFNNVQKDKLLHFIFNAIITYILFIGFFLIFNIFTAAILSFSLSLFIAAAKEIIWDKILNNGVCNFKDFFWGAIGSIFEILSIILIIILF